MASTDQPNSSASRSTPWLWVSAAVLLGLILIQIGQLKAARSDRDTSMAMAAALAMADGGGEGGGVSKVGDYTVMTFSAGSDDALAVLDARAEELYVYRVKNNAQFEFVLRENLPDLFTRAKAGRKTIKP